MEFWELATSWNYFLSIEEDLNATSRYIEPDGQENVHSFEFYKIIMLSCVEIESAFKQMCNAIDPSEKIGNMSDYKRMILGRYPKICECEVVVSRWHARAICPFEDWDKGRLKWWETYQAIKHNRFTDIMQANYKNAVYSLAALYVLILYLYKINGYDCKADDSKCFWSKYYPLVHYLPPQEQLPDFIESTEKAETVT